MSSIKAALTKINSRPGVVGALLCSHDGLVVESALSERFDAEALSALASSIDVALSNTCKAAGFGHYTRYHVSSNNGGLIITDLGRSIFVVITDAGADISQINVEVFQASTEIKKHGNIG